MVQISSTTLVNHNKLANRGARQSDIDLETHRVPTFAQEKVSETVPRVETFPTDSPLKFPEPYKS
jgi:hypothetical protein